jgi:hypothetical protein
MKTARAATIAAFGIILAAPAVAQDQWQWNGRVDAGKLIEIKGINGGIRAVAANGNEVRVQATKNARRSDPDSVTFEVVPHADGITICAIYPARRGTNECRPGEGGRMNVENNDVKVEWVVQVPRGVNFVARTINGSIEASGLPASVNAVTVNGPINISTAGIARATSVNGDIEVSLGRADWSQGLRFSTTNGEITITLPGDLNAEVTASTVNGDIDTEFPLQVRGRFGPKRISGTIGSGGRTLSLNTVNGDITIRRR